jgi:thioredoxin reductase (NADPH)
LVDDDRAILEALETTLDPLFGEICRIEAFVDPGETLEATARWAEEGRPLALAIVDQKMPGMTGTELLKRLRATCSCSLSLSLWF